MKFSLKRGDQVFYVPSWVSGDLEHPDCEAGVITKIAGDAAWVKYVNRGRYGGGFAAPQRTAVADLIPRGEPMRLAS